MEYEAQSTCLFANPHYFPRFFIFFNLMSVEKDMHDIWISCAEASATI
jgi:hypothetical protein